MPASDPHAATLTDLITRLHGPAGTGEALKAISESCEAARAAGLGSDAGAMRALDAETANLDPILRESALAAVSGDLRRYLRILGMLDAVLDLASLEGINQIYWSMQRQLFLMRMDMASVPDFVTEHLFAFYERFLRQIALRLGLTPAARQAGMPDTGRVVIVTNQFLSAEHQPSRDLLLPGYGFGLGFAVRTQSGFAPQPGSPGQYFWSGIGGTSFFVDPREDDLRG